tara:strand:+ start:1619 stop:2218 length:600 start_codon:yes stop_codon:yes gene_type:complete
MTQKRTRQKPGDEHYVNNHEFTLALDEYAQDCKKALAKGKERPVMSRYLGECVYKMANRLSLTPRFKGYMYRDEMVQNAILGAMKYMYRFDGERFDNGFAYVTQILFSHMIQTIKNEKKKYELNLRLIQEAEVTVVDNPEFTDIADQHARAIADQKLEELQNQKVEKGKGGFTLRTGYTKESREAYKGGTPLRPKKGKK